MASDGARKTPAVIHRAIYGSLERFIGILLEHTAGALPIWLAPVQVAIVPVTDDQSPYAHTVARRLTDAGLRVEVDATRDRMQAKIRAAQLQKVPYMLVVGKREAEAGIVAVRVRSGRDLGAMPIAGFLDLALPRVASRSLYLDDVEEAAANAETDR